MDDYRKVLLEHELSRASFMRDRSLRMASRMRKGQKWNIFCGFLYILIGMYYVVLVSFGSPLWYLIFLSIWWGGSAVWFWTARRKGRSAEDYESAARNWTEVIHLKAKEYEEFT